MHVFVLGGTARVLEQWGVPPPSKRERESEKGNSEVSGLSRAKPTGPEATKLVIDPFMKQNEFGVFGFIKRSEPTILRYTPLCTYIHVVVTNAYFFLKRALVSVVLDSDGIPCGIIFCIGSSARQS